MDDNTFIRYDSLGTFDSHVTSVSSLDDVLFLGNSYGDIKLIKGRESQILHNHHGEITTLVCRRCYRTGRNDSLYLFSGTSIGNIYLHLVFLDKVTGSRILYKFVTSYSVFSICPHPEFDVFNFKRLTNRLTVDFTNDLSKDSDNWKELPSLSISVESFILSLSNGGIYLVHNSNSFSNYKVLKDSNDNNDNTINSNSNADNNNQNKDNKQNQENKSTKEEENERYVIMCISLYSPYSNMKMNWHKRYISWIDREGFYVYLLPNFVSILYIPIKHFGKPFYRRQSLGFKEKMKKTENIHYLYNIIDNSELYVSTDESDISPMSESLSRRSSVSSTPRLFVQEIRSSLEKISNNNKNKENKQKEEKNNKIQKMKRLKNRFVNHKYFRNNNSYGTMSRFLSDSILVGCNNTLLGIRLLGDNDEQFGEYHSMLLSTFPSKDVIGYRDMRSSISSRRKSSLVRGYIDFKLVFPEHFNVLHVCYSSQTQFNLIVFDEGPRNLADKDTWKTYQFEKCNRSGSVTRYKLNLPDQFEPGNSPREGKSKITNMIFNLNSSGSESMCSISLVHCESISVRLVKASLLSENIIISAPTCPENSTKDYVYIFVNNSLIRINYCSNYFNFLKYYINNCYNQNIVVSHFKSNLVSMLNSNIGCMSLAADDKGAKYVLDYIGVFVDYILDSRYYEGFKIIVEVLNRYGKLPDFFESVFTQSVRIRLELLGFHDRLVDDLVEIIDEGNSLIYLHIIEWKLNEKVYTSLVNKIKTILVNQIYYLYNMFQDSEINMGSDSAHPNIRTYFTNESYFDVLILLNNLNNKTEVELGDVYSMLYQFLQQTACKTTQESLLSYNFSKIRNIKNNNKYGLDDQSEEYEDNTTSNADNNNEKEEVKGKKQIKEKQNKEKEKKNNMLEMYSLEDCEMYNRLLCLKYYHKCLSDKLASINTRGVVFPGTSGRDEGPESWYMQRVIVNCNICNSSKAVYDKILSRLINKVGGEVLDQNELQTGNVLYFPCRHLVHEKCQVRLINQVREYSPVNTPTIWKNEENFYYSNQLLDTCLVCLTK